jgi:hypothetical protein
MEVLCLKKNQMTNSSGSSSKMSHYQLDQLTHLQELGDSIAELVGAMQKQIDTADLYKNKEDIMCH